MQYLVCHPLFFVLIWILSDVNKDLTLKAKDSTFKAKAKDRTFEGLNRELDI